VCSDRSAPAEAEDRPRTTGDWAWMADGAQWCERPSQSPGVVHHSRVTKLRVAVMQCLKFRDQAWVGLSKTVIQLIQWQLLRLASLLLTREWAGVERQ
jgi:hypothetical protein